MQGTRSRPVRCFMRVFNLGVFKHGIRLRKVLTRVTGTRVIGTFKAITFFEYLIFPLSQQKTQGC